MGGRGSKDVSASFPEGLSRFCVLKGGEVQLIGLKPRSKVRAQCTVLGKDGVILAEYRTQFGRADVQGTCRLKWPCHAMPLYVDDKLRPYLEIAIVKQGARTRYPRQIANGASAMVVLPTGNQQRHRFQLHCELTTSQRAALKYHLDPEAEIEYSWHSTESDAERCYANAQTHLGAQLP
jgi:hypothetical protein